MVNIDKKLYKEFTMYCELNEIEDIDNFIVKCSKYINTGIL